jgi:hypothetical protein
LDEIFYFLKFEKKESNKQKMINDEGFNHFLYEFLKFYEGVISKMMSQYKNKLHTYIFSHDLHIVKELSNSIAKKPILQTILILMKSESKEKNKIYKILTNQLFDDNYSHIAVEILIGEIKKDSEIHKKFQMKELSEKIGEMNDYQLENFLILLLNICGNVTNAHKKFNMEELIIIFEKEKNEKRITYKQFLITNFFIELFNLNINLDSLFEKFLEKSLLSFLQFEKNIIFFHLYYKLIENLKSKNFLFNETVQEIFKNFCESKEER